MSSHTESYNDLSPSIKTNTNIQAKLVPSHDESLRDCAKRLREEDELVAFPTETVYGLGAHALHPDAIHKIFAAKRRPLTDPLICHVLDTKSALQLWDLDIDSSTSSASTSSSISSSSDPQIQTQTQILTVLCEHFFPGPLTIVAKCNTNIVPDLITAGTGYVAVRSPSHPLARKILEYSHVPIAAPSANRFGHVSPTKSSHVMHDLSMENVWVVQEGSNNSDNDEDHDGCCHVGVESTVAKVDASEKTVTLLRQGAISANDIQQCLEDAGLGSVYKVDVRVKTTSEQVANIAPGQTVRHYSPDVLSFMISETRWKAESTTASSSSSASSSSIPLTSEERLWIQKAVILDFGNKLHFLRDHCLAYRDLSPEENSNEGAAHVFDYLRWAEQVESAERIYFPELDVNETTDALTLAMKDRLTRAASGVVIDVMR